MIAVVYQQPDPVLIDIKNKLNHDEISFTLYESVKKSEGVNPNITIDKRTGKLITFNSQELKNIFKKNNKDEFVKKSEKLVKFKIDENDKIISLKSTSGLKIPEIKINFNNSEVSVNGIKLQYMQKVYVENPDNIFNSSWQGLSWLSLEGNEEVNFVIGFLTDTRQLYINLEKTTAKPHMGYKFMLLQNLN